MTNLDIFIEKLREKLSIVDIVGKKVNWDYKKSNVRSGTYWACCPFHNEKTASFKVDENKGLYYCFGCHEKGDTITFVMKNENLDFLKSIQKLANEVGLILPSTFGKGSQISRSKSYNSILDVNKLASLYFADCLKNSPSNSATLFLKNRISSSEISNIFNLGYAPNKNKGLLNFLIKKGYREDIIISSGLCSKNDRGEIYDRFRDRIIFPIHNSTYEIVGFGGRALSASANAKYLNSPETEVFQKGKLLFNENNCKKNLNGKDVIIVEGYMDVIALNKVGIKNCVAPLGTAVTLDQLQRIWRISKSPIFAFDGDISGLKALERLTYLVLPHISSEKTIKACILPQNQDPDDLISKFGKDSMNKLLQKPEPLLKILWDNVTRQADITTPENRVQLENKLNFIVNQINERSLRFHYSEALKKLKLELFSYNEKKNTKYPNKNEFKLNYKNDPKNFKHNSFPSLNTRNSLIANANEPNLVESHLQETAIVLLLINHPNLLEKFITKLNEINFINEDIEIIFKNLVELISSNLISSDEIVEKLSNKLGKDIYNKLYSTGPLKIHPLLNKVISIEEAESGLNEILNKKIARQYIEQELIEAKETIHKNDDESFTWRISQANKFFNEAIRGKNYKKNDDQSELVDDLEAINNLIKDRIWIKKNY
jgi:DNA primase